MRLTSFVHLNNIAGEFLHMTGNCAWNERKTQKVDKQIGPIAADLPDWRCTEGRFDTPSPLTHTTTLSDLRFATMIKVTISTARMLYGPHGFLDMEHEEERGCGSQEEAQSQRRANKSAEGCVPGSRCPSRGAQQCLSDLTELDLPKTMTMKFDDPADLLNFTLTITPDEGAWRSLLATIFANWLNHTGMYKGGAFLFSFAINTNYPHDPPKVKCKQIVRCTVSYTRAPPVY